ncbi:HTH_Tnp_Tc3_2 domain-containing protein [Trichonephila clavipes]|nr:HTH_Tnp_Tc3_2 domain-containing protein [Trichonephila clavipes]
MTLKTILRLRMPLRRNRRQYEQLTDFDSGRIIGLREAGWSNRRIGRHLGRSDMTSSAIKRNHRRRLTEVGLRSRRPLRRLPLTPHHRQCRLDFCRPRATWSVTDWRRVIFSDESRFSLSDDDHRTRVWEAHRPAVRSGIYCRAAYSNFTRCDSVGSNFLGHTIIFSGPSRHFDSSQIRGRYFNADCATHAIKSPRCHLSTG